MCRAVRTNILREYLGLHAMGRRCGRHSRGGSGSLGLAEAVILVAHTLRT